MDPREDDVTKGPAAATYDYETVDGEFSGQEHVGQPGVGLGDQGSRATGISAHKTSSGPAAAWLTCAEWAPFRGATGMRDREASASADTPQGPGSAAAEALDLLTADSRVNYSWALSTSPPVPAQHRPAAAVTPMGRSGAHFPSSHEACPRTCGAATAAA